MVGPRSLFVGPKADKLSRMRWSKWTRREAIGRGVLSYNTCKPSCVDGRVAQEGVRVRLHGVPIGCTIRGRIVQRRIFTSFDLDSRRQPGYGVAGLDGVSVERACDSWEIATARLRRT